jgi:hypothetical protein
VALQPPTQTSLEIFTACRLSSVANWGFCRKKVIHGSARAVPIRLLPTRILQVVSLQMFAISVKTPAIAATVFAKLFT